MDIDAKDAKEGKTPLIYAAKGTKPVHYDIAKLLLDHGADINAVDNKNKSPMDHAYTYKGKISYSY